MKTNSVNPLYLKFNKMKYLTLVSTNESKDRIKKYEKLWIKIRDSIRLVTKKSDDYDDNQIKIKLDSHDELPPNKTIEIPVMIIVVRIIFYKNNKYYAQVFLDECLYKV